MLNLLPELAIATLSYLPLHSLGLLPLVCRHWNDFFILHESILYHNAAALHGFIPSPSTLFDDLPSIYSKRSLIGVNTWKDLCRRRLDIPRSWAGKAPSTVTEHRATGRTVHRIKVDEKAGYIMTTSQDGGLLVTNIAQDETLWSLPNTYVREFAHLEYDDGFIIFDRLGDSKEVWRRSCDCHDAEQENVIPASRPDNRQRLAEAEAAEKYPFTSCQGHFKPWAILHSPEATRAFRFVYPTLLITAWDRAYLWDVRTGERIQTIENIQHPMHTLGDLNYVEVSRKHVFLCGMHTLRVFSRETGSPVFDLPSSQSSYGIWQYRIAFDNPMKPTSGSALIPHKMASQQILFPHDTPRLIDEFIAVHVSQCGSHIVALLATSRLIIVPNFEQIPDGIAHTYSLDIQLGSPRYSSRYLAFENGRIAVATGSGLFVVEPDWSSTDYDVDEPPKLSVSRISELGDQSWLGCITCLQMTDTALFVNWDSSIPPDFDFFETVFYQSLEQDPIYARLPNGDRMILIENGEQEIPEQSTVVSVDFLPT